MKIQYQGRSGEITWVNRSGTNEVRERLENQDELEIDRIVPDTEGEHARVVRGSIDSGILVNLVKGSKTVFGMNMADIRLVEFKSIK